MMLVQRASRAHTVTCRNEATDKIPTIKKLETQVSNRVKENLNKFTVMAAVDFKLMYEIAKEVDEIHKNAFAKLNIGKSDPQAPDSQSTDDNQDDTNSFLDAKPDA